MSAIIGRHESSKCALSRCDAFPALHADIHEWLTWYVGELSGQHDFSGFVNKADFWDGAGLNFFHNKLE